MKRIILSLLLVISIQSLRAQQPYFNEWIDYNKTYYKFKIGPFGTDPLSGFPLRFGIVRIPQSAIAAAGLGEVRGMDFALWRDGQEVPIYVSNTEILGAADYIEFFGSIPDGKPDSYLYKDPNNQLADHTSLETDSASYFLTVNTSGLNRHLNTVDNNTASTKLPVEKSFRHNITRVFRGSVNYGFGVYVEEKLYSSSYDIGEGLASRAINSNSPFSFTLSDLNVDTLGSNMTVKTNVAGASPNDRQVRVSLNGELLSQFPMGYFQIKKLVMEDLSPLKIKNNTATFLIENTTGDGDEIRLGVVELAYPRLYNFSAATSFEFYVDASHVGRYLKIANFSKGTATPVLYDFTNNKRYIGNIGVKDTIEFALEASVEQYHLLLLRNDGSTAKTVTTLSEKKFVNFNEASNQGDYLIISNPLLFGSGSTNYVEQYRAYRSSDSGGKYNAKLIDIYELEDQFAYGIKMHPLSIKNFLRFARAKFSTKPEYAFLIGKGVTYANYRLQETNPLTIKLNLIPVFGSPGSDNLLASEDYSPVPATPIGRLSAVTADEVGSYLAKVKEYESAQRDTTVASIESGLWKKKVLQLAGSNDPLIETIIDSFQVRYSKIISGPSFGGNVTTFSKSTSTGTDYGQSVLKFTEEYNSGSALVEYLGHSSSTSIDFSLDNPANYNNTGKYPMFIVNGCLAGNIFEYDANRYTLRSTLSEKFILEPGKGAIGYLSSSNYGVLNYLDVFTEKFYNAIAGSQYGKGFGHVVIDGLNESLNYTGTNDFYGLMHAEQLTLHGDPSIKLNSFSAPDYALDSTEMTVTPGYLNVTVDSITLHLKFHNLGKATGRPADLSVNRTYPSGVTENIYHEGIIIDGTNEITLRIPIIGNRDKGINILTAIIDVDNKVDELREDNNTASVSFKVSAADLLPVSPYNFSIVTQNQVDLIASTAYAFDSITQYVMELDTTSLFNSPVKLTRTQIGKGGIIEFNGVPVGLDNTVYFWRVAEDSTDKNWNTFSFIYRSTGNAGFEQAHFLQHTESSFNRITTDSTARKFNFGATINNLFILHSIYPTSGNEDNHFSIAQNGRIITWSACVGSSIIFNVFDPKTFKAVPNTTNPYGAATPCDTMRRYNFEFSTKTAATRKNAMDFMDNYIQNGYYVVARKIYDMGNNDWAPTIWAADTALYGKNNSLYHRLKNQGINVDSFTYPRTFVGIFKKNDSTNYKPITVYTKGLYDRISLSQNFNTIDTIGSITSPKFGPGTSWNKVKWSGYSENGNNTTTLDVIAYNKEGKDSVFYNIPTSQAELDVSAIDAASYPYVQLRMNTTDSITQRPYQLTDWSVEAAPIPEGAIATNLGIDIPEKVTFNHAAHLYFDTLQGYIIFKNISAADMQPLKVRVIMYDSSNVAAGTFDLPYTRALPAGDTVHIPFLLNITDLEQGKYNFYIEVNPDADQPEQYHYNNFLYKYVDITRDVILASRKFDLAAKPSGKAIELKWTVTNEYNVARYDVEFSTDGRNFTTIGQVAASNITDANKYYGFVHNSPVNGINYYRIKMIDKDGAVSYSPVRDASINVSGVLVYPNPFKHALNVIMQNVTGPVKLRIMDLSGRVLMQQSFTGSISLSNLNKLSSGVYVLQVTDGKSVHSFRLIKEK